MESDHVNPKFYKETPKEPSRKTALAYYTWRNAKATRACTTSVSLRGADDNILSNCNQLLSKKKKKRLSDVLAMLDILMVLYLRRRKTKNESV